MTYEEFINNILETRGRNGCGEEYHEKHHIVPRCMGGTNDKENLIDLFAREHFEAHRLLALENPENHGLVYAWFRMSFGKNQDRITHVVTAEEYEEARIALSRIQSLKFKGRKVSDETRRKMSESQKGRPLSESHRKKLSENHADFTGENGYWYGKHFSESHRIKLSLAKRGNPSARRGFHLSEEQKEKISNANKGRKLSEHTKEKMSKSRKGKKTTRSNIICQYDENYNFIEIYDFIQKAADKLHISQSHISDCCRGGRKTAGGYHWKYLYDQTHKDGTTIPGAITLGLITEEEALKMLEEQKDMKGES